MADIKQTKEMGLMDHIQDLRTCLIHCSWWVLIGSVIAFYYNDKIYHFLWDPYVNALKRRDETQSVYTGLMDPFTVAINQAIICGILLASPFIIYEIFKFVAPALKKNELATIRNFSIFSLLLFLGGIFMGYSYMLPRLAIVMEEFRLSDTKNYLNAKDYLQTVIKLILGLGIIFQFPLLMYFLVKIGILKIATITENRKIIIVVIFIISAFATPPDILSLFVVATPFYLLFEITIICCKLFIKQEEDQDG
jgi:sec-independent protein translocase protein TatC